MFQSEREEILAEIEALEQREKNIRYTTNTTLHEKQTELHRQKKECEDVHLRSQEMKRMSDDVLVQSLGASADCSTALYSLLSPLKAELESEIHALNGSLSTAYAELASVHPEKANALKAKHAAEDKERQVCQEARRERRASRSAARQHISSLMSA